MTWTLVPLPRISLQAIIQRLHLDDLFHTTPPPSPFLKAASNNPLMQFINLLYTIIIHPMHIQYATLQSNFFLPICTNTWLIYTLSMVVNRLFFEAKQRIKMTQVRIASESTLSFNYLLSFLQLRGDLGWNAIEPRMSLQLIINDARLPNDLAHCSLLATPSN